MKDTNKDNIEVTIILCVFNEIERAPMAIEDLLQSIERSKINAEILIIDNASTDGTREWLTNINNSLIKVILNNSNLGKGGSIKKGIIQSRGDYVVIHDPDMEYKAEDIWPLLEKVKSNKAGMGLGSRLMNGKISTQYILNYFGVVLLTKCINILYNSDLTDSATALKICDGDLVRKLNFISNGFDLDFELVVRILRCGYKIVERETSYNPRSIREGKKIKASDGISALIVIIRDRFVKKYSFIKS
jgi:glycosyltransferase involved in cell wall biosynthesis